MRQNLYLLCVFVIIRHPAACFYNLCHSPKNNILSNEECSELYFQPSEKETNLGRVKLELEQGSLRVTPVASSWTTTFMRITMNDNMTNKFCSKLSNDGTSHSYCINFKPEMENQTFLLEYKIEKLPEISSRKFLFSIPNWQEVPLFPFIDVTDTSSLVLTAQKLPSSINITYYKVEAYKEKNSNTNLQDLRLFSHNEDIYYKLFTYNDEGNYYFIISVMDENCTDNLCLRIISPKVYIGRKSTRVVIGIVGASFILPFVLFIFHILTKKYPSQENQTELEEKLVVAYKSSSKKHNEVVFALAAFLEKAATSPVVVEVIDLSKNTKKLPEKFCVDSILLANRIIYVAPPKHDLNPISIDKAMIEKEFFGIIFDHCVETLPQFIDNDKTFKLFEDFEKFIHSLNISSCDIALYEDLKRKTDEAKIETDLYLNSDILPKIVITESEPQEHDSLISTKVVL